MSGIFSERAKFARWLEIEILAVEARVRLEEVPVDDLSEIKQKAAFDVERIAAIESVRQHDVVAFVENVRENVGEAGRHIHYGMTSSDVLDTATAMALEGCRRSPRRGGRTADPDAEIEGARAP